MKKVLIAILATFVLQTTEAQTNDFSITIPKDSILVSEYASIETFKSIYSDEMKTIIIDTNYIAYFSFNIGDDSPNKIYKYEFKSLFTSLLNYEERKDGMLFFVQTDTKNHFMLSHEVGTNKWNKSKNYKIQGEKYLCNFKYKNTINTLHLNRKENKLVVYQLNDSTGQKTSSFDLGNKTLNEKPLSEYLRGKNNKIKLINTQSPNELFAGNKKIKLYLFNDELYLVVDDAKSAQTAILKMNLINNKLFFNQFSGEKMACDSIAFNYSSLTKDYLIKVTGCKKEALISIIETSKNKLIKTHSIPSESLLDFVVFDNIINTNKKAESIERIKPKQLIQSLMTDKGSTSTNQKGEYLVIQIGFIGEQHKMRLQKIQEKQNKQKAKLSVKANGKGKGNGMGNGKGGGKGLVNHKLKALNLNRSSSISKSYHNYLIGKPRYLVAVLNLTNMQFETTSLNLNYFEEGKSLQLKKNSSWMFYKGTYWFNQLDVQQHLSYQTLK